MKFSVQKSCQQFVAMICFWSSGVSGLCLPYSPPSTSLGAEVSFTYSDGFNVGSLLKFDCKAPFQLQGSTQAFCSMSNTWTFDKDQAPQCLPGNGTLDSNSTGSLYGSARGRSSHACAAIPGIGDGTLSCTNDDNLGSLCTVGCDSGFSLVGISPISCLQGGWSHPVPSCQPVSCPPIPGIANGVLSCSDENNLNSVCAISCKEEFTLVGGAVIRCNANGWSSLVPICKPATCDAIPGIENGILKCTNSNRIDSWCSASCNTGFSLHGSQVFSCASDGWSSVIPQCWYTACTALDNPLNGLVTCSDASTQGSRCTYTCFAGFELRGNATVVCRANKAWSGLPATCRAASCPPLAPQAQGSYTCTDGALVASECTFSCIGGYRLVGDDLISCGTNLYWSAVQPTCANTDCEPPAPILLGPAAVCSNDSRAGSQCYVECTNDAGTALRTTYKCQEHGQSGAGKWKNIANDCAGIVSIGGIDYACENSVMDVMLVVTDDLQVQNTRWFIRQLLTSWKRFIHSEALSIGFDTGSMTACAASANPEVKVKFQNNNYKDIDDQIRLNYVTPLSCGSFIEILRRVSMYVDANGRSVALPIIAFINHFHPLTAADIAEAESLIAVGVKILILTESSYRTAALDSSNIMVKYGTNPDDVSNSIVGFDCPGTKCPIDALTIPNGQRYCRYIRGSGTECEFSCNVDHVLRGDRLLRCLGETTTWSGPTPVCRNSDCPSVPSSPHRTHACSNANKQGSTCAFQCAARTFISGDNRIVCQLAKDGGGVWSKEPPTCETDLLCQPPLFPPAYGALSCPRGNRFNEVCVVACNEGYTIRGYRSIACRSPRADGTAQWDSEMATCEKCLSLPCEKDVLIAVVGSGSITKEQFDKTMQSLIVMIRSLKGAIEEGKVHVGIVQINGKATLFCDSGFVQRFLQVELNMASHAFGVIVEALRTMKHLKGCASPAHAVKRGATYLAAVGRPQAAAKRVLVLVSNGKADETSVVVGQEIATVKQEGVDVIVLGTEGTRLGDLQRLAGAQGKVVGVAKSGTSSNSPESQALVESILKGSGVSMYARAYPPVIGILSLFLLLR